MMAEEQSTIPSGEYVSTIVMHYDGLIASGMPLDGVLFLARRHLEGMSNLPDDTPDKKEVTVDLQRLIPSLEEKIEQERRQNE